MDIGHDGCLCLLDDSGNEKEDLNMPEGELGKEIQERFDKGEQLLVSKLHHI
jgi:translation initiation factor 5A